MTVEYTFALPAGPRRSAAQAGHVEPGTPSSAEATAGTEVTIACRVQDDLGGEGMKAMKLKVE